MYLRIKKFKLEDIEKIEEIKGDGKTKVYTEFPYIKIAKEFSKKKLFSNKEFKNYFLSDKEISAYSLTKKAKISKEGVLEFYENSYSKDYVYMDCNLVIRSRDTEKIQSIIKKFGYDYYVEDIHVVFGGLNNELLFDLEKNQKEKIQNITIDEDERMNEYIHQGCVNGNNFLNLCIGTIISEGNYLFDLNNYFIFKDKIHYQCRERLIIAQKGQKIPSEVIKKAYSYLCYKDDYILYSQNKELFQMKRGKYEEL